MISDSVEFSKANLWEKPATSISVLETDRTLLKELRSTIFNGISLLTLLGYIEN